MDKGYELINLDENNKAVFDFHYTMKVSDEDREVVIRIGEDFKYLMEKYIYPFHKNIDL